MSALIPGVGATASALGAERMRLEVAAMNIANAHTTRDINGQVYRRKEVVFESLLPSTGINGANYADVGVKVSAVRDDPRPLQKVYQPGHPDADAEGMVSMPNVNVAEEMVDLMTAGRAFEANTQVLTSARQMLAQVLRIGR